MLLKFFLIYLLYVVVVNSSSPSPTTSPTPSPTPSPTLLPTLAPSEAPTQSPTPSPTPAPNTQFDLYDVNFNSESTGSTPDTTVQLPVPIVHVSGFTGSPQVTAVSGRGNVLQMTTNDAAFLSISALKGDAHDDREIYRIESELSLNYDSVTPLPQTEIAMGVSLSMNLSLAGGIYGVSFGSDGSVYAFRDFIGKVWTTNFTDYHKTELIISKNTFVKVGFEYHKSTGLASVYVDGMHVYNTTLPTNKPPLEYAVRVPHTLNSGPIQIDNIQIDSSDVIYDGPSAFSTYGGETFSLTFPSGVSLSAPISVHYGASYSQSCNVVGFVVTCTSTAGTGANLRMNISTSSGLEVYQLPMSINYLHPRITSVESAEGDLNTIGDNYFTINGNFFGPSNEATSVITSYTFGNDFQTWTELGNCTSVVAQTKLKCYGLSGAGYLKSFTMKVAKQLSNKINTLLVYNIPVISTIVPSGPLDTIGNNKVTLIGEQFGTFDILSASINATMRGPNGGDLAVNDCSYVAGNIECTTPEGMGGPFKWSIGVAYRNSLFTDSTSYRKPTFDTVANIETTNFPTSGGGIVTITGANFGPIYTSSLWNLWNFKVTATYGVNGNEFTAVSCNTTIAHTEIKCIGSEGFGQNLKWILNVGGIVSDISTKTSAYNTPTIDTINSSPSPTIGNAIVQIFGQNFGPVTSLSNVTARYSKNFNTNKIFATTNCTVITAHTQVECTTVPGGGNNLRWQIKVFDSIYSNEFGSTSYIAPNISSFDNGNNMITSGTEFITLIGTNFGPLTGLSISATYSPDSISETFIATNCQVIVAHTKIQCTSAAGIGNNLRWTVVIEGLSSTASLLTTSYAVPIITKVEHIGTLDTVAASSEFVTVTGTNFGPAGLSVLPDLNLDISATFGGPIVWTGCSISTPHQVVLCENKGSGLGANKGVSLTVGGQTSNIFGSINFTAPIITSIDPKAGPETGNTRITIVGQHFGSSFQYSTLPCENLQQGNNANELVCDTRSTLAQTFPFFVTTGGQNSSNTENFYFYRADSFAPSYGHSQGVDVTVTGFGFTNTVPIQMQLDFNVSSLSNIFVTGSVQSSTTALFEFRFPLGTTDSSGQLSITQNSGQQYTIVSSQNMSLYETSVTSIDIKSGPLSGSTPINVGGYFFPISTPQLRLRSISETVECTSESQTGTSQLSGTTGSSILTGLYTIEATIDSPVIVWTNLSSTKFLYYNNPIVSTLTPNLGPIGGGTRVEVAGNFVATEDNPNCRFASDTVDANFTTPTPINTASNVVCLSPATTLGTNINSTNVALEVAPNGVQFTSSSINFLYYRHPTVSSVVPSFIPMQGGSLITVEGENFIDSPYLYVKLVFSSLDVTVSATFNSTRKIIFQSPDILQYFPGDARNISVQIANVTVSLNQQQYTQPNSDAYIRYYPNPIIDRLEPKIARENTSTNVVLHGFFFDSGSSPQAQIGTELVSCTVNNALTQYTCPAPALKKGTYKVQVTIHPPGSPVNLAAENYFYYHSSVFNNILFPDFMIDTGTSLLTNVIVDTTELDAMYTNSFVQLRPSDLELNSWIDDIGVTNVGNISANLISITIPTNLIEDNPVVSVIMDSKTILSESKTGLDSQCLRQRFFDNDGRSLDFFVNEALCNTTNTITYVRLKKSSTKLSTLKLYVGIALSGTTLSSYDTNTRGADVFDFYDNVATSTNTWVYDTLIPTRSGNYRQFQSSALFNIAPRLPTSFQLASQTYIGFQIKGIWKRNNPGDPSDCREHFVYWSQSSAAMYLESNVGGDFESIKWNCSGVFIYQPTGHDFKGCTSLFQPNADLDITITKNIVTGFVSVEILGCNSIAQFSSSLSDTDVSYYIYAGMNNPKPLAFTTNQLEFSRFYVHRLPYQIYEISNNKPLSVDYMINEIDVVPSSYTSPLHFNVSLTSVKASSLLTDEAIVYTPPSIVDIIPRLYLSTGSWITVVGTGFVNTSFITPKVVGSTANNKFCEYINSTALKCYISPSSGTISSSNLIGNFSISMFIDQDDVTLGRGETYYTFTDITPTSVSSDINEDKTINISVNILANGYSNNVDNSFISDQICTLTSTNIKFGDTILKPTFVNRENLKCLISINIPSSHTPNVYGISVSIVNNQYLSAFDYFLYNSTDWILTPHAGQEYSTGDTTGYPTFIRFKGSGIDINLKDVKLSPECEMHKLNTTEIPHSSSFDIFPFHFNYESNLYYCINSTSAIKATCNGTCTTCSNACIPTSFTNECKYYDIAKSNQLTSPAVKTTLSCKIAQAQQIHGTKSGNVVSGLTGTLRDFFFDPKMTIGRFLSIYPPAAFQHLNLFPSGTTQIKLTHIALLFDLDSQSSKFNIYDFQIHYGFFDNVETVSDLLSVTNNLDTNVEILDNSFTRINTNAHYKASELEPDATRMNNLPIDERDLHEASNNGWFPFKLPDNTIWQKGKTLVVSIFRKKEYIDDDVQTTVVSNQLSLKVTSAPRSSFNWKREETGSTSPIAVSHVMNLKVITEDLSISCVAKDITEGTYAPTLRTEDTISFDKSVRKHDGIKLTADNTWIYKSLSKSIRSALVTPQAVVRDTSPRIKLTGFGIESFNGLNKLDESLISILYRSTNRPDRYASANFKQDTDGSFYIDASGFVVGNDAGDSGFVTITPGISLNGQVFETQYGFSESLYYIGEAPYITTVTPTGINMTGSIQITVTGNNLIKGLIYCNFQPTNSSHISFERNIRGTADWFSTFCTDGLCTLRCKAPPQPSNETLVRITMDQTNFYGLQNGIAKNVSNTSNI